MRLVHVLAVTLTLVATAHAQDAKPKKSDPAVDSLFGDAPPATSMDALKKAAEGPAKQGKTNALDVKGGAEVKDTAPVVMHSVFAAEKIVQDPKKGCQPAKNKKRIKFWSFDEVPINGLPFAVCLTLSSEIGREVTVSIGLVDARNQKILKAEDVIDFRGRTSRIDHVLEYPAPTFKLAGEHQYVLTIDGKEAGRLPLFVVKTDAGADGVISE
jgi:hypothetical protein